MCMGVVLLAGLGQNKGREKEIIQGGGGRGLMIAFSK